LRSRPHCRPHFQLSINLGSPAAIHPRISLSASLLRECGRERERESGREKEEEERPLECQTGLVVVDDAAAVAATGDAGDAGDAGGAAPIPPLRPKPAGTSFAKVKDEKDSPPSSLYRVPSRLGRHRQANFEASFTVVAVFPLLPSLRGNARERPRFLALDESSEEKRSDSTRQTFWGVGNLPTPSFSPSTPAKVARGEEERRERERERAIVHRPARSEETRFVAAAEGHLKAASGTTKKRGGGDEDEGAVALRPMRKLSKDNSFCAGLSSVAAAAAAAARGRGGDRLYCHRREGN